MGHPCPKTGAVTPGRPYEVNEPAALRTGDAVSARATTAPPGAEDQ